MSARTTLLQMMWSLQTINVFHSTDVTMCACSVAQTNSVCRIVIPMKSAPWCTNNVHDLLRGTDNEFPQNVTYNVYPLHGVSICISILSNYSPLVRVCFTGFAALTTYEYVSSMVFTIDVRSIVPITCVLPILNVRSVGLTVLIIINVHLIWSE
jgi:hypothetical protein